MPFLKSILDNLVGPKDYREAELASAREALTDERWADAGFHFQTGGAWKDAGDAYLEAAKSATNDISKERNLECALGNYFKAQYTQGVLISFEQLVWLGRLMAGHFDVLRDSGAVALLIDNLILRHRIGEVSGDGKDKRMGLCFVFERLLEADELDNAERLLLHYINVIYSKYGLDLVKRRIKRDRPGDALRLTRSLAESKFYESILDATTYAQLTCSFSEADEIPAANEMLRRYYIRRTGTESEWVLDLGLRDHLYKFAAQWDPKSWGGHLLWRLKETMDSQDSGDSVVLELSDARADSLACCYKVLGARPAGDKSEKGTSEWLTVLADYWMYRKHEDKATEYQEQCEKDRQLATNRLHCRRCREAIESNWSVCPHCRLQLARSFCRTCLEPLKSDWGFCPVCEGIDSIRRL